MTPFRVVIERYPKCECATDWSRNCHLCVDLCCCGQSKHCFASSNLLTSSLSPLLFFHFPPGLNCTFKILCWVPMSSRIWPLLSLSNMNPFKLSHKYEKLKLMDKCFCTTIPKLLAPFCSKYNCWHASFSPLRQKTSRIQLSSSLPTTKGQFPAKVISPSRHFSTTLQQCLS